MNPVTREAVIEPTAAPHTARRGNLTLTGERTLPGLDVENYWFRRHEAVYGFAARWTRNADLVLDTGAGEGYGAAKLSGCRSGAGRGAGSGRGARVVALDYDPGVTDHLNRAHARSHAWLDVVCGNAVALPFADASLDAVIGLQVIEHLWDQPRFLAECARVLRPGGDLVLSTPNRLTFSPGYDPRSGRPSNLFHTREFSYGELADLLAPMFPDLVGYGLHAGPRLAALDEECRRRYGGNLVETQLATGPGAWPGWLREAVAGVTASDFRLSRTRPDDSLDLVFHTRRR